MAYWMITNRNQIPGPGGSTDLGGSTAPLTYWMAPNPSPVAVTQLAAWTPVAPIDFQNALLAAIGTFPVVNDNFHEDQQKHVSLLIHGYNNTWSGAANFYQSLVNNLYSGPNSLGECLFFTWPSWGSPAAYLPDRQEARDSAQALATVLLGFYTMLEQMQPSAAASVLLNTGLLVPKDSVPCRAKFSVLAHSMGNYLLQNAMHDVWTRKNQPLLVSLVTQLLMIAADVDNDLFKSGATTHDTDGDAIANLTYRVTALYSGLDQVLGLSAGLKHFGKRRLGRSGLDKTCPVPDNVWDVDCSSFFSAAGLGAGLGIHGDYFSNLPTLDLMRQLLQGTDRKILAASAFFPPQL